MNYVKVDIPMFSGATKFHDVCKILNMEDSLEDIGIKDATFKGEEDRGYINISMYSPVLDEWRDILHFKKGMHIDMRECYAAMVHCIKNAFAEELI